MDNHSTKELQPPIEIPRDRLSPDILEALVEEFILREGTDYGSEEVSLARKKEQIFKQLEKNDIKIAFDPNVESATLMTAHQFKKLTIKS